MPTHYHIGELSSRTGRSIHAIRWYEAQGLIPGVIRDAGGRRVYNERHQGWLELMERLRRTGMSIRQMREYTSLVKQGRGTLKQRRELLAVHRAKVEETIAEWTVALRLLDSKLDFYGEWLASGERPQLNPSERSGMAPVSKARKAPKRPARKARAAPA
jgi:DNA-binding transcriptional MerR regulator